MRFVAWLPLVVALPLLATEPPPPNNEKLWSSEALKTPYEPVLSEAAKAAAIGRLWAEVKFNFANFDLVPELDWDAVYVEYLPRVLAAETTLDVYRLLGEMVARLRDGHSYIIYPKELRAEVFSRPEVTLRLIDGRVFIEETKEEIVAVGDLPVADYAARFVRPHQWASTPQDLDALTYEANLLAGRTSEPVSITTRDALGVERRRTLPRAPSSSSRPRWKEPTIELQTLPSNVGLLTIRTFNDPEVADKFEAMFDQIASHDALIIDLRENGGGNGGLAYRILGHLTDKPYLTSRWRTRRYIPMQRARNAPETWESGGPYERPNASRSFGGPVAVLTSARTYSAAEDFLVAFDTMQRGVIIGVPTGGSTGQPMWAPLPGGGAMGICSKRDSYPDGTEFVGVGVQPDVAVAPTVEDFRAGRDTVLRRAQEWISSQ